MSWGGRKLRNSTKGGGGRKQTSKKKKNKIYFQTHDSIERKNNSKKEKRKSEDMKRGGEGESAVKKVPRRAKGRNSKRTGKKKNMVSPGTINKGVKGNEGQEVRERNLFEKYEQPSSKMESKTVGNRTKDQQ